MELQASDFGPKTSLRIVDQIRDEVKSGKLKTPAEIRSKLKSSIISVLEPNGKSSELQLGTKQTGVIFVVGVNGGGKTTTIGKLAHKFRQTNAKVRIFLLCICMKGRFKLLSDSCDNQAGKRQI